jgi:hypothetical protein
VLGVPVANEVTLDLGGFALGDGQGVGVEADDAGLAGESLAADFGDHHGHDDVGALGGGLLDLDEDDVERLRDLQRLGEGGDDAGFGPVGVNGAGVEGLEFGQGHVGHGAGAVGGAVNGGVVNDDQLAVGREMDIELDDGQAEVDGVLEAGEGVLRGFGTSATMANDLGNAGHGNGSFGEPGPWSGRCD